MTPNKSDAENIGAVGCAWFSVTIGGFFILMAVAIVIVLLFKLLGWAVNL